MDPYQARVWYERAIYYQQIGDQENAKRAYQLAQNYDPKIPPLPKAKKEQQERSIWRKLEMGSLIMACACLIFILILLWQNPYILSDLDFPWRMISLEGKAAQSPEPETVMTTSSSMGELDTYTRSQRTASSEWRDQSSFHLLRNALYYYLADHPTFPKKLDLLVEKKYLSQIPTEPGSGSNRIYRDFTDTGGWLYTPPTVAVPYRRKEQIEVALGPNRGNVPHQPFQPMRLQVDQSTAHLTLLQGNQPIKTWPISVGLPDTPTPAGTYRVIKKNILSNSDGSNTYGSRWLQLGEHYPYAAIVPAEPDRLAPKGIGIHGTNEPGTIGTPNTQGCIRMRNSDVEELYDLIPNGIEIRIE